MAGEKRLDLVGKSGEAILYFAQYAVTVAFIGFGLYLFTCGLLARLRAVPAVTGWSGLGVGLALAPSLALYYFMPFFLRGFLNYAYVVATIALGAWFLVEVDDPEGAPLWNVTAFLLLAYGASASWPLLTPPLFATGALVIAIRGAVWLRRPRSSVPAVAAAVALGLQLVPIYLQLRYGIGAPLADLGLGASFGGFHAAFLGAGLLVVVLAQLDSRLPASSRHGLAALMLPLLALVAGIALMQGFRSGQIGYYTVKLALPAEMLLLCVGVAVLWGRVGPSFPRVGTVALALVPLLVTTLLLSVSSDPAADARGIFRDYSGAGKPPMYEHDLTLLVTLGRGGRIAHANTTAIHVRPDGSLYQHEQLPFWADVLSYDSASAPDRAELLCVGNLYQLLAFLPSSTAAEQQTIVTQVRSCADLARSQGWTFYIVTDAASALRVRQLFGASATIVQ